ncbi:hypothetical protein, partial [Agrobacterium sp. SUL3]|uniref:hypothetical protein n=1 Tax=Agrobacterium sp. SUL3 TaxID=1701910 RepID=UPI0006A4DE7A
MIGKRVVSGPDLRVRALESDGGFSPGGPPDPVGVIVNEVLDLGSGLIDQSQKITVAARAMAERKTIG